MSEPGGRRGRVLVLNGASSSGKSSIARAAQTALVPMPLVCELDAFIPMLPRIGHTWMPASERTNENAGGPEAPLRWVFPEDDAGVVTIEFNEQAQRLVAGMHRTVAALASGGDDVIVDHVLLEEAWKDDLLAVLGPHDVAMVGIRCSTDVLRDREAARGDRVAGQAEGQVGRVHAGVAYDLEIDVTDLEAREAAAELVRWLVEERGWTAADA